MIFSTSLPVIGGESCFLSSYISLSNLREMLYNLIVLPNFSSVILVLKFFSILTLNLESSYLNQSNVVSLRLPGTPMI